jgi:hypothetical protein
LRGVVGARGGDVVVEFLSAQNFWPSMNLKEQKKLVRENRPRTSHNGATYGSDTWHSPRPNHEGVIERRSLLTSYLGDVGIKISGNGGG